MAIYSGTSGRRRGSVGNETYTITRGQNIVKEKVLQPLNPRTQRQQTQRAKFASAIEFYKFATRNFFKFAFEDKTNRESDYNAYMRYNAGLGIIFPRPESEIKVRLFGENGEWPMVAPWKLTEGRLAGVDYTSDYAMLTADEDHNLARVRMESDYYRADMGEATTIGGASADLIEAGMASAGDILTFVWFYQSKSVRAESAGTLGGTPGNLNEFEYRQIIVDPADTRPLSALGFNSITVGADTTNEKTYLSGNIKIYNQSLALESLCAADAVVRSRKVAGGLEVSTSVLKLNDCAQLWYEVTSRDSYKESFLRTWNTGEGAVLAGEG